MAKNAFIWATAFFGIAIAQCPSNFKQYGNRCYQAYGSTLPWSLAEGYCQDLGGNLASIHDNGTTSFLLDLARQNVRTAGWIGLRDRGSGPAWSDKSIYNYTNFAPTRDEPPICYALSAVSMYYPGQWIPIDCATQSGFICGRGLGIPATTVNPFTCGPDGYYDNNGTIPSPGYPQIFWQANCNWQISVFNYYANIEFPPIIALGSWSLDIYSGTTTSSSHNLFSGTDYRPFNKTLKISSPNPQILIVFSTSRFGDLDAVDPFLIHYSGTSAPLYPIPTPSTINGDSKKMNVEKSN